MALNISDSFCEAVDQIVTARMQEVKFDKTVVCTIVDDENAGTTNYYTVSEGSSKFSAYSVELYKKNEQVLVLIPQGDYNNQKTIIGKYVPKDDTGYTFLDLKDQFLPLVTLENNDSLDTKSGNKTFSWELDTVNTATCTHIYMSANFNAVMQRQSGNYGIKLVVRQANQITVQYLWDSSELFGNPFQFTNAALQETIITLNTPVVDIENIQFSLYHPELNEQNGEYIAINDITCQIGYLLQETYLDELIIDVNNEKEKFYPSRNLIAETNKKLLELKSIIQYDEEQRQYVTNDNDQTKAVSLSQEIQQAFADLYTSPLYKVGEQDTEIKEVIDTAENIEKGLLNDDAIINENKYLIRALNLTWKHVNPTTGQINIYKNESSPPEPLLDNELPEGTTIEIVRWYIESGNPYEEIEEDKIAEYEIPDIKPFGTTFKQFINSSQNSTFYPLTARIKLLPESITARAGAVLIPLVLTKIPGSENLQWIQNGASVKSELLTFQQDGAVIAAADLQENTNIPKNVVNIAIGNAKPPKDENDRTIHEVQGSYYYGNIISSQFQASNIYSIICYFQSDYKEGEKVRYIKQSGDNITAQLTMPNGQPAPTGAFKANTLGILLIKEDNTNPIIQLPFII